MNSPSLHPSIVELLGFFDYEHLPEHLQVISKPFHDLAQKMVDELGVSSKHPAELTVGLRKLLEAKDCMVRAAL
jgi:hypothetical protein